MVEVCEREGQIGTILSLLIGGEAARESGLMGPLKTLALERSSDWRLKCSPAVGSTRFATLAIFHAGVQRSHFIHSVFAMM